MRAAGMARAERIGQRLHRRRIERERRFGDAGRGAVAKTEAATRKSDLAETRGQQHDAPERLLAVIGALQRP